MQFVCEVSAAPELTPSGGIAMATEESGQVQVRCGCGAKINAPARAVGRKARCPKCGDHIVVQAAPGPAPTELPAAATMATIKVRCDCGARLAAPARAVGRTAKCPRCQRPIEISAADEPLRLAPHGPRAAIGALLERVADGAAGLLSVPHGARTGVETGAASAAKFATCSSCGQVFPGNTLICIECGINIKTARLVNACGGDVISAVLGRYAWGIIGKPNRPAHTLW
jgi:uncharacterized paraquat-inducible protein A